MGVSTSGLKTATPLLVPAVNDGPFAIVTQSGASVVAVGASTCGDPPAAVALSTNPSVWLNGAVNHTLLPWAATWNGAAEPGTGNRVSRLAAGSSRPSWRRPASAHHTSPLSPKVKPRGAGLPPAKASDQ